MSVNRLLLVALLALPLLLAACQSDLDACTTLCEFRSGWERIACANGCYVRWSGE